jgi:membrane-associated protease RseP (regulator of RpoE activity)
MKAKYLFGLLAVIILATGIAIAQQPATPPAPPSPPADVEPFEHNFSIFIDGGGYLGVVAENINNENMGRYRLNQVRGIGVTQVVKDSPAEKAGIRKDDVILRIDGEAVNSVRKLNRLISEMAPDHNVRIAVSRGGAEQELTATIGKRNNPSMAGDLMPGAPRVFKWEGPDPKTFDFKLHGPMFDREFGDFGDLSMFLQNGRRIGVSTVQLTKQLADYFGVAGGNGVLVTAVTDDGPAAKAGVKAGDVITAVDGETIDSPGDISRVISRKKEGDVTLTVIRNKSQQTIRVTPSERAGFSGTPGRSQVGRTIVIPRVHIPDIEIALPRIDINMPRIRVTPRPRVRTIQRPI